MSEISITPFTDEEFADYYNWCKFSASIKTSGFHKNRDKSIKRMFSSMESLYSSRYSFIKATSDEENPVSAYVARAADDITAIGFVRKVDTLYRLDISRRRHAEPLIASVALATVVSIDSESMCATLNAIADEYPDEITASREPMVSHGKLRKVTYTVPVMDPTLTSHFESRVQGQFMAQPNGTGKQPQSILYY